jgi:hypothetical protein
MKLNDKQKKEMQQMFKDGKKVIEIAAKFKVYPSTVTYHIFPEVKQKRIKQIVLNFRNKSTAEKQKIYAKRKEYIKNYQRNRSKK